ncbi:hypothetical protein GCM10023184_28530 [Flaviaesturariibacter amylovorans]|uniref:T9SS type A sorting domain-containing protein n=2 Tax=Flaviaesturariibacter amylovorans TaxID=1084520 RepID=A0ABP8H5E5_9BACT
MIQQVLTILSASRLKTLATFLLLIVTIQSTAQTYIPGKVVRPATLAASRSVLDPNSDGFVSSTTNGYYGQDDVSASNNELQYKPIYPFFAEPNSDLRRGPDKRFTDYVPSTIDKASYYMYYTGSNVLFRVRMGSIIPGAKGYSFLIDIDGKFGASGPLADPNYLAQTTGVGGNPGFEIEVDLFSQASQTGIAVYNIDGKDRRNDFLPAVWSVQNWLEYSQVSMAATSDNGDPDYYVDFYVPFSVLSGINFAAPTLPTNITTSTPLRIIPTTVMAPLPAVGGPKSDIYGLPDNLYPSANDEYIAMLGSMPPISIGNFASGGSGQSNTACTAPPTINKVSSASATTTISGTWTPNNTSGAIRTNVVITVYRSTNGGTSYTAVGTTTVTAATQTSTVNWSLSGVPVASGNLYYATAQAPGESTCYQSATTTAANCATPIPAPIFDATCNTDVTANDFSKGFSFTNKPSTYSSSFAHISNITRGTTADQTAGSGVAGTGNIGNQNNQTISNPFAETGGTAPNVSWTFSAGCSGGAPLSSGSYRIWYTDPNGCASNVTTACVVGSGQNKLLGTGSSLTVPALTSPANGVLTSATTSMTVSATQGSTVTFFLNGVLQGTAVAANGGVSTLAIGTLGFVTFTVPAGTLSQSDRVRFISEYNTGTLATSYCGRNSDPIVVSCTTEAPNFTTNSTTNLMQPSSPGGFIQGTSSSFGGTVRIYNSTAQSTVLGTATVGSTGSWTSTVTPVSGQSYVATVTATNGCASGYSPALLYNNSTTPSSRCTGAGISSYTTSYLNGTSYTGAGTSVTNGPPASSTFAMNAFATSVSVSWTGALPGAGLVSLYEDGNFVASTRVAAGATTAVFSNGTATGDNLGFYTGTSGSTSPGNVYFTISDTSTTLQTYLPETTCPNVGVVTCPVTTTTPTLTVANCPTCTATGSSSATVPSGGTVTFKLTNVTPNTIYALRSSAGTSYSNTYTVPANFTGTEIYLTSFPITGTSGSTVTIEAVGTTVIVSNNVTVSCAATSTSATVTLGNASSLSINGSVFNDVDAYPNISGTPVSAVTNAAFGNASRPLYVYLVNSSNVIQAVSTVSSGVNNTGSYVFTGLTSGATYRVILDTVSNRTIGGALTTASVPFGWAHTAEGTSGSAGDGTADGIMTISNLTTSQVVDFGLNGIPVANTATATAQVNPGGTTSVTVPATTFSGSDPRDVNNTGLVEYIRITSFPTNATSITITGSEKRGDPSGTVTYYPNSGAIPSGCVSCSVFPAGGVYVPAASSGTPTNSGAVQVDPTTGAVTVGISYVTVDNANKESATATASQPFTTLAISGTVYNDFDGLTDGQIDGVVTNAAGKLRVNAISGGSVVGSAIVAGNGTYSIAGLDVGTYTLVLDTTGTNLSALVPAGYAFSGEGAGAVSDGTVNGTQSVSLTASNVTARNFGVNQLPTADAKLYMFNPNSSLPYVSSVSVASTANGANTYAARITLSGYASSGAVPGALTGLDPDGNEGSALTLQDATTNTTVIIDPATYAGTRAGSAYSNAIMPEYAGIQLQPGGCQGSDIGNPACALYNSTTAKWEIPAYDLGQLTLLVRNGASGINFSYSWKDKAGGTGTMAQYAVQFSSPLPVHLLSFTGVSRNSDAVLNWAAENEVDFRGYSVERSFDGRVFTEAGFVNGRNQSSVQQYRFEDNLIGQQHARVYYRLKQVDINGVFRYSNVVSLSFGGVELVNGVKVRSNPVRGHLQLLVFRTHAAQGRFIVTDAAGRVVLTGNETLSAGLTLVTLSIPGLVANGSYQVVTLVGAERFTSQIILAR